MLGKEQRLDVGVLGEDEVADTTRMEQGCGVVSVHGSHRGVDRGGAVSRDSAKGFEARRTMTMVQR